MIHPPVLFIGDRPSKHNVDKDTPFVGTRSYKTLLAWIYEMNVDISRVYMCNAYDADGNPSERLYGTNRNWKIVVLGENARKRLADQVFTHPVEYFVLPHPSGLNRKLNDKNKLKKLLIDCKEFIYDSNL